MQLEKVSYAGWDNCLKLTDGKVELIVTLDVGPRVIRFGFVDGQNLFHNFPDQVGKTGGDEWLSYGGHRLWHAPEVMPRTYYPDNNPVQHEWDGRTLRLTPPPEHSNNLQLGIDITLEPDSKVLLNHRITNIGVWDVELSPWCLSVMAAGGRAIVPQEPYKPHPDCLVPARPLVLWHFIDMSDPRWTWGKEFIQLRQDNSIPSKQKVGAGNTLGWAAYTLNNDVFVKRFAFDPDKTYPDMGCNCELFTMPDFLEVETLGPLTKLAPGQSLSHLERWGLYQARIGDNEASIKTNLLPLVDQTPGV